MLASPQVYLTLATNLSIYIHEDDECRFILSREHSFSQYERSQKGKHYKYIITARYYTSDYTIWTSADLPEIGEWSVVAHKRGNINNDVSPTFTLQCKKYNNNSTINHNYTLWYGDDTIVDTISSEFKIYKWGFGHWGNRPSIEDLYQIRFAKEKIFAHNGEKASIDILLVRDVQDRYNLRHKNKFDDIYFYIAQHYRDNYYDTILAYVVPRIYFIKLENNTIQIDSKEDPDKIRFSIIVQHPLSSDGKSWEFHRLEILKEFGIASFITINDLGPVPRSEWEPDWPDPAATPLWKAPESECAQCE